MNTPKLHDAAAPAAAGKPLRLLLLEDNPADAKLIVHTLRLAGLAVNVQRVETPQDYISALEGDPELILADYSLPEFNAMEALMILRESGKKIPFIIVSGSIGEETAVEALKLGAADCVNKDKLARLGPVVARALRDTEARSEQLRTDERLRNLSSAVEHSPAAIIITDADGAIEYVNPKFVAVTGYTAEEVIGQSPDILKSGETSDASYEEMWRTIRAGGEWHGEFHNRRKDGELFWETASISGIRDESGAITHFVAVKEDITERKSLEAQFLRAQRLEGIGTLASGVAHDLNNILAPILMAVPLLHSALAGTRQDRLVSTLETCAQRGTDIVRQVLTFARGVEGQRTLLQTGHLVREMEKIARETFPRAITVRNSTPADLWPVTGDATQLHQVLLNLCVNARDAMPGGGTLTLGAENVELDAHYAGMVPGAQAGPHLLLKISDTGTGIPPEVLDKIFDPFFTTKEHGQGTGLGLSTAMGIAKSHGGFMNVTSEAGRGTTFEVFLPASPGANVEAAAGDDGPVPQGHGELILVADDEAAIRAVLCEVLDKNGYRTVPADDGAEAIARYAQHREEIAAVITDLMMPHLDGLALSRALKRMNPEVPIIACTGLGEKSRSEELRALGIRAILAKPHTAGQLLRMLHEALESASHPALAA